MKQPPADIKLRLKEENGKKYIFDPIRKAYVLLTPEEMVRQKVIHDLVETYGYPRTHIAVEKELMLNRMKRRTDIVVHDRNLKPVLIVECKSPDVKITQKTFDQIGAYNYALHVPYLYITNGRQHFFIHIDFDSKKAEFLQEFPRFDELENWK